jgi:hypothetical protein
VVLSAGCAPLAAATTTPTPGYYPDLFISMKLSYGASICGYRYSLTIDDSGNVNYEGKNDVAIKGKRSATIRPQQVEELVDATRRADVWALQGLYARGFDLKMRCLAITLDGRSKTIEHQLSLDCGEQVGLPPMALCELEHKIDAIADRWVEPTATP